MRSQEEMEKLDFVCTYLDGLEFIVDRIGLEPIEAMVDELVALRNRGGRLFLIGVGGSAANCSHAAADFRTLCNIKAYAMDNLANVTALTNDEGWEQVYRQWLMAEELSHQDLVYVMSVGGGSRGSGPRPGYSFNLVQAMELAYDRNTPIIGVAGRDGGRLAELATAYVLIPTTNSAHVTPHTESMQAVIWHLLVSHPSLKIHKTAWEGK